MNRDVAFNVVTTMAIHRNADKVHGKVLDIGCGAKPYKRLFYDPVDRKYGEGVTDWIGLDVRPVGEVLGRVEEMPLKDDFYDTVICVDTLSYVFDIFSAFSEMVRVLKPGGHLIVVEPNCRADDSRAFWGFRAKALGALAEKWGLTDIDLETAGRLWNGEYENLRGQVKYGFGLPPEFQGWIDALEDNYPNASILTATK